MADDKAQLLALRRRLAFLMGPPQRGRTVNDVKAEMDSNKRLVAELQEAVKVISITVLLLNRTVLHVLLTAGQPRRTTFWIILELQLQ